jgi:hypothetical protein
MAGRFVRSSKYRVSREPALTYFFPLTIGEDMSLAALPGRNNVTII